MKLIISHLRIKKWYISMAIFSLGLSLLSACKEDMFNIPLNTGTIRFAETAYTVELNNPEPTTIILPLSLPLEEDAEVDIVVDEQSTALPEEYEINPEIPANGIKIQIKKGETEVRFTLNSLNNFEGEKNLILKLASAKGGLIVSNTNATATVRLKGNPILYPELRPSVNDLAFGSVETGTLPPSQSYVLSGTKVTADVTVFASANYEVSLDDDVFSNTLTIPLETIETSSVTVYVRFLPHTGVNQSLPGTITHSSAGIPDAVVRVSGVETGNVLPGILVSSENFEYGSVAGNITALSGGRWTAFSGTVNLIQYKSAGLSYAGYIGSGVGGAITSVNGTGSREDISMSFNPISSGAVYVAQMLDLASAPATHDFFLSLGDGAAGATPTYLNRIYARASGAGYQLGLGRNSATAIYGDGIQNYGTTYLVVHKFEFLTGTSTLYILDSTIPVLEPTTGITSTAPASDPASITRYVVRQNTGNPLTATIDGIRVATSWKDAVGL